MKAINWAAWISGGIGVVIILLGVISGILGRKILPVQHIVNYFVMANSFFLITIALFVYLIKCQSNK
jgi:cytosine/uracil/thiamine/allantoin permease